VAGSFVRVTGDPPGAGGLHSHNAVSREWLKAYERGLGEQYSLHASDPHMGWDGSGAKDLVGSQFVLARDVDFRVPPG
jgi:hypothetical protein